MKLSRAALGLVGVRWYSYSDGEGRRLLGDPAWALSLSYLAAIGAAEAVTALYDLQLGVIFHALLMGLLLLHSALVGPSPLQRLLLTLALAPLVRIVSLGLPLAPFPQVYWYLLTGAPLVAAAVVAMWVLGTPWRAVGLSLRGWAWQPPLALAGVGFGAAEFYILRPAPLIAEMEWRQALLPALILFLATGFAEELLFRGVVQRAALDALGIGGLVYGALLFAILHLGYLSALDVAFVFGVGLLFAVAVYKTGSLAGATLSHGLTNIFLFLVFPFLL